jgi:hypothetical protein
MVANSRVHEFRQRLADVESRVRQLRLEAFVDYAPVVCGVRLRPLTLPTYTTLLGFKNAFVCGTEIELKHIVQFVWLHHPEFGQFNVAGLRTVARAVSRSLTPFSPWVTKSARFFLPFLSRRWWLIPVVWPLRFFARCATHEELLAAAIDEIRRLVHEATHDFPCSGDDEKPAPYALTAGIVSLLHRGYSMDFTSARALASTLPLKQLLEFVREVLYRASQGKDKLLTAAEAKVWADWLDFKNEHPVPAPVAREVDLPGAAAALGLDALNSQPSALS